ncbi:MAG TPA: BlaI/MecI/CopY family transcriptional regulator [Planctomycetaceae bacterium]|nr:BlaI/MecI/CopY family transcriptional regulator [Planctomycetaceae bacterium]
MPRKRRVSRRLSAGEIEILEMLWRRQPVSIAEAHQALGRKIGYTTVQTRLNRLTAKGLVRRSDERPARYSAAIAPEDVSRSDLDVLVERVNAGRVVPLVAHLVRDRKLSADEISELKQLIEDAERHSRGRPAPEDA